MVKGEVKKGDGEVEGGVGGRCWRLGGGEVGSWMRAKEGGEHGWKDRREEKGSENGRGGGKGGDGGSPRGGC